MLTNRWRYISMKAFFSYLIINYLSIFVASGQDNKVIKLIFAGDIMCHSAQLYSGYDSTSGSYDFLPHFEEISGLIQSADLAMANLETTLPGSNYSGYPLFGSPDELVIALHNSGFNLLFTANNHSLDKGVYGLQRTIRVLNQFDLLHTGTFTSKEEQDMLHPLIVDIKGLRIALINYSYGTNRSIGSQNFLMNQIDTTQIATDILLARKRDADVIICYLHWGDEYASTPNEHQIALSQFLHNKGVMIVAGSHPHVVQQVQTYRKNKEIAALTAYSLGNLISNQRIGKRKAGLILEVVLQKEHEQVKIREVIRHPTFVERTRNGQRFDYLITLPASPAPTSQTAGL